MAKRKNKKNKPVKQETAQTTPGSGQNLAVIPKKTSANQSSLARAKATKAKSAVSIPVFFSGMFLTLVLGIYLGTLAPEISLKDETRATLAPGDKIPVPAPTVSEAPPVNNNPAPEQAPLPRDIAAHVAHLKTELEKHPDNAKLWTELGDLYFDANLPQLSIESYGKALALNPRNEDVLTDMGIMYRELGEFNNALDCFRNANSINPRHTQSLYNQGLILSHDLNDKAGAAEAWEKLLQINPEAISPSGKPVRQMLEELK